MGKSAATQWLHEHSIRVADTDVIAREVVAPGQPALQEIRGAFGPASFHADGSLNRDALAKAVFSDETKRRQLEGILHPKIRDVWQTQADRWRRENPHGIGVVVIPLLFETGAASWFESVVCVACSTATQQDRLQRRGWSSEQIQQRLRAQWSIEEKIKKSDVVLWTEGTLDVLADQLRHVLSRWEEAEPTPALRPPTSLQ